MRLTRQVKWFHFLKSLNAYLLGLVVAVVVTVREVESCELLSQFLLRESYCLQCCVQFDVTGTLWKKGQTVRTTHTHKQINHTAELYWSQLFLSKLHRSSKASTPSSGWKISFNRHCQVSVLTCRSSLLRMALSLAMILSWPSAVSW